MGTLDYPGAMALPPEHLMPSPIGRDPFPRQVLAEHQRDRVVEAAIEIFAKRGYRGATVGHLVSGARVGVNSFYSLFEGKEECFLTVYDQIVAEGRRRMRAAVPAGAPWPEQIAAALRALLELIEEKPLAARIALVEVHTAGPRARAHHERDLEEVAELLRAGRAHSPVPDELPQTLEVAVVGGLAWLLQQRIAIGEAADIAKLLPEVLEIVVEPYLGEQATAELIERA
jgi:AcrR family transcriptional regulator